MYFIFENEGLGMAMILALKMTILGQKMNSFGPFFQPDREDSLARPPFDHSIVRLLSENLDLTLGALGVVPGSTLHIRRALGRSG
jgi:hypothetical protein